MSSWSSIVVENHSFRTQARPSVIDQQTPPEIIRLKLPKICPKICITLHVGRIVQKRHASLQESLHIRIVVVLIHAPFRDPERPLTTHVVRLSNILLKVDDVVGTSIPMYRHKIDRAAGAIPDEIGKVGQRAGGPAIRYCWRAE